MCFQFIFGFYDFSPISASCMKFNPLHNVIWVSFLITWSSWTNFFSSLFYVLFVLVVLMEAIQNYRYASEYLEAMLCELDIVGFIT